LMVTSSGTDFGEQSLRVSGLTWRSLDSESEIALYYFGATKVR